MEWFRLYDKIIDEPRFVRLTAQQCRHYIELLCVANRQPVRGTLPSVEHVAIHLRIRPTRAARVVAELVAAGLVDEDPETGRHSIHGWDDRAKGMGRKPR